MVYFMQKNPNNQGNEKRSQRPGEIESTHCKRSHTTPGSLTIELESNNNNNNNKIGIVLSSYLIRDMNGK